MPKTTGKLWEQIIHFDNIYSAYLAAQEGHRTKRPALAFRDRLEENLIQLQNELIWHQWRPSPPHYFTIKDPKPRCIAAPAFRDRVAHHALVQIIEPCFERRFISDSYACRAGKGTHAAVRRAQQMIRSAQDEWRGHVYIFKGDIKSYFKSIDHDILKKINRRTIRDRDALWMLDRIIDAGGDGDKGLDIGALTSQLEANVYADILDHQVKDVWRYPYYERYMDDFIILGGSKTDVRTAMYDVGNFVNENLLLKLNPKSGVFPASQGLDFCGYRIWATHILPRKRNTRGLQKKLRGMARRYAEDKLDIDTAWQTLASYLGYMKHCNGYRTKAAFLEDLVFSHAKEGKNDESNQ